jgi:hypothetical protein
MALTGSAAAADLEYRGAVAGSPRAGHIVYWDFEPGIVTRAYWLPPYANRHFFPMSDAAPRVGRHEDFSAPSKPVPAKSFYREWSSFPVDVIEPPPALVAPPVPLVLPKPRPK